MKNIMKLDDYRHKQHVEMVAYVNRVIEHEGTQAAAARKLGVSKHAIANLLYRARAPRDQRGASKRQAPKLIKYAGA